jgi:hypothetical protein
LAAAVKVPVRATARKNLRSFQSKLFITGS